MKIPWRRTHTTRGAGILTVLIASTLLLLMAFTVAGTAFHHLSMSNRLNHGQKAKNLAEAALARAIAELMHEHTKYQGANPPAFPLPAVDDPDRQKVFLTFNPDDLAGINAQLKQARLKRSLNNFGNDAGVPHEDRTIPGETAYLCAVGVDHGVERSAECVIYIPKFPWSLASAGPIKAEGKTRVSSVKDFDHIGDPTQELPGHLVSNSSAIDAVRFEGNEVVVTGDVQALGGGDFGDNVILGERRLNYKSPAPIPSLTIEDYSTFGLTGVTTFTDSNGPNEVSGYAYRDGGLNFSSGLKLEGGVVYVNGDVTINGQIEGKGAIIATGKIDINGHGALASSNKVAILAKGDLELRGTSTDHLSVEGLLYTEGQFYSENVDIIGNTVSAQGASGTPGMILKDTNVYSSDSEVTFQISGPPDPPRHQDVGGATYDGSSPLAISLPAGIGSHSITGLKRGGVDRPMVDFWDSGSNRYILRYNADQPRDQLGNPLPPGVYRGARTSGGIIYDIPAPSGPPVLTPEEMTWEIGGQVKRPSEPADFDYLANFVVDQINAQRQSQSLPDLTGSQISLVRSYLQDLTNPSGPSVAQMYAGQSEVLYNGNYTAPGTMPVNWTLDINNPSTDFIARAERIRLLYWRDMP